MKLYLTISRRWWVKPLTYTGIIVCWVAGWFAEETALDRFAYAIGEFIAKHGFKYGTSEEYPGEYS